MPEFQGLHEVIPMIIVVPNDIYDLYRMQLTGSNNFISEWYEGNKVFIITANEITVRTGSRRRAEEFVSRVKVYGGQIRVVKRTYVKIVQDRSGRFLLFLEPAVLTTLKEASINEGLSLTQMINKIILQALSSMYQEEYIGVVMEK